jgi:hypothetical protein
MRVAAAILTWLFVSFLAGLFTSGARADTTLVQIEPDDFPPGTNLSQVSSAATLFSMPGPTDLFAAPDPNAPTGILSFSRSPSSHTLFSRFLSPTFEVEFFEPVTSVSLDFRNFSSVQVEAIITAFDSDNNVLGESRELLAQFDFSGTKTVTVTSSTPIKFITAGGGPGEISGTVLRVDNLRFEIDSASSVTDTCDVGGGPNDIETVTASYDDGSGEIIVEMNLCAEADNKTRYTVYFDHQDTTDLDGDGVDDGPDTLDPNPDCVRTWDDRMVHKGMNDQGPGMIDVVGSTLTFRVGVPELNPFLELSDTVLIWTDTKLKNDTDRTPNTEPGDGCARPEVASEVISLELN